MTPEEKIELLKLNSRKLLHFGKYHELSALAAQAAQAFQAAEAELKQAVEKLQAKYPGEAIDLDKL